MALKVFVANYGSGEYLLENNETLTHFLPHAGELVPTYISPLEIICVKREDSVGEDVWRRQFKTQDEVFVTTGEDEINTRFAENGDE